MRYGGLEYMGSGSYVAVCKTCYKEQYFMNFPSVESIEREALDRDWQIQGYDLCFCPEHKIQI